MGQKIIHYDNKIANNKRTENKNDKIIIIQGTKLVLEYNKKDIEILIRNEL